MSAVSEKQERLRPTASVEREISSHPAEGEAQDSGSIYDAVVMGGGPAGASAAACLAQAGRRVLVLERSRFPRFHVGESLLPLSNEILDRLGLREKMERIGSTPKFGATFCSDLDGRRARIDFREADQVPEPQSFHVPRAQFDELLLDRARELGSEVREATEVLEVQLDGAHPRVLVRGAEGESEWLSARYLLDATGRRGVIAKQLDLRVSDRELRKTALFAHFRGIPRQAGQAQGDIQVVTLEGGSWAWLIPLSEGRTSVGFVFDKDDDFKARGESPEACLERLVAKLSLFDGGSECIERLGPAHWESNFSYSTKRYFGDNWLLLGDAGSFLDPVFSTGILLALAAGVEGADAVNGALGVGDWRARRILRRFGRTQGKRYRFFRKLVLGFYRPVFRELMFEPETWPSGARALASLLAGQSRPGLTVRLRVAILFWLVALKERQTLQTQ